jgi:hypothetical protein
MGGEMNEETAKRIIDALDVFRENLWRADSTEQTEKDVIFLRDRYGELKWRMPFSDAARRAKIELILHIISGEAQGPAVLPAPAGA